MVQFLRLIQDVGPAAVPADGDARRMFAQYQGRLLAIARDVVEQPFLQQQRRLEFDRPEQISLQDGLAMVGQVVVRTRFHGCILAVLTNDANSAEMTAS